jgi:uroporphyrinogen decarboxylase
VEGVAAIGLDTAADVAFARNALPPHIALQGNLDPLALLAGGAALDAAIDKVRRDFAGRPHIFNLGHGILPQTPIAHVEHLVKRLRTS